MVCAEARGRTSRSYSPRQFAPTTPLTSAAVTTTEAVSSENAAAATSIPVASATARPRAKRTPRHTSLSITSPYIVTR